MVLLSALLTIIHVLLLLLLPPLIFLWIIGKFKAIRLRSEHLQQPQPVVHPRPSPTNIPLQPRRLSFSSAATTNTPTPTQTPKRRVTFSLTPEQQANELLKIAVRRRESLPSANLLVSNESSPPQYNPQPQQVAHLFPLQNPQTTHFDPPPPRSLYPFSQQPHRTTYISSSAAPQKRNTSPSRNQTLSPKRQRNPFNLTSGPSSLPIYAADLRREQQQSNDHLNLQQPHYGRSTANEEHLSYPEYSIDNTRAASNMPSPEAYDLDAVVNQDPHLKQRHTPPSDRKPPKPPRSGTVPNGFSPQSRMRYQQDGVGGIRQNGFMSRSVR